MFTRPFSFHGRINNGEYALSVIVFLAVGYVTNAVIVSLKEELFEIGATLLILIPLCLFMLAQTIKRSHDIGNSGWYICIPFYPLYLFFIESDWGNNAYGLNPNGDGNGSGSDQYKDGGPIDQL
jgi:uncharacterized membrane protein YhaH (DUF805 family)